jgi:hypothetical protein
MSGTQSATLAQAGTTTEARVPHPANFVHGAKNGTKNEYVWQATVRKMLQVC